MKRKKKILKVRPFNMANFSGGSGYLVFSLIYQFYALLPATVLVWLLTLVKLPKDENGNIISNKASKRFDAVTIPLTIVFIIGAVIFAAYSCYGYGDLLVYSPLIIFIGIAPALCSFFILRHFHSKVARGEISTVKAILSSILIILIVIAGIYIISIFLNTILEQYEAKIDDARFEAEIAEYDH